VKQRPVTGATYGKETKPAALSTVTVVKPAYHFVHVFKKLRTPVHLKSIEFIDALSIITANLPAFSVDKGKLEI